MLRKLAGQTAIYGLSTIVPRFLNFLLVPYLTRIMGTGQYGTYSEMYALIPLLLTVLTMGMETGYFRFTGKATDQAEKNRIFSTTWGAVLTAAGFFMAIAWLLRQPIANAMQYPDHVAWIVLVAGIVFFDVATAIPFARLRQENRPWRFVALRLSSVVINIALCVFFYSVLPHWAAGSGTWATLYDPSFGPGYAFVANLVASAIVLFLLAPVYRGALPRIDRKLFRTIFLYSLPLLLSGITGTASEFIDRQLIKYLLPSDVSLDAVGIYSAVAKLSVLIVLFTQMYRYAAEPFFLSGFGKDDFIRANATAMNYFLIVSVAIFLVITLFPDVFALFLGENFRSGIGILPVMLLSNILAGVLFNLSFWYKYTAQTRFALYVTLTGLVFSVVLNLVLIPRIGYEGAAWARLGCEIVMVSYAYYLNQKHFRVPYDLKRIFLYLAAGAVLYTIGTFVRFDSLWLAYSLRIGLILIFVWFAVKKEHIRPSSFLKS